MQDEIKLSDIVKHLYINLKTITVFFLTSVLLGIIYTLSLDNIYTSTSLLKIKGDDRNNSNNLLGAYAPILGLSFSESNGITTYDIEEVIFSRDFFKKLITDEDVLINLSLDGEDLSQSEFENNYKHYKDLLEVKINTKSNSISLNTSHTSPSYAFKLNERIISEADLYFRNKSLESAKLSLEYLTDEYANSNYSNIKEAINNLTEVNLQKLLQAKVSPLFLLEVIDTPNLPLKKSEPTRTRIVILFALFGIFLGVIYPLTLNFFKSIKFSE